MRGCYALLKKTFLNNFEAKNQKSKTPLYFFGKMTHIYYVQCACTTNSAQILESYTTKCHRFGFQLQNCIKYCRMQNLAKWLVNYWSWISIL